MLFQVFACFHLDVMKSSILIYHFPSKSIAQTITTAQLQRLHAHVLFTKRFKVCIIVFELFLRLFSFNFFFNSNTNDVLGHKYVFGPTLNSSLTTLGVK